MTARRVIAVVGPTAAGKSGVAVELAGRYGGEIVNADSRQVYRGMDIGTAKPDPDERARVPHHLYDIASPDGGFSLGVYLDHARGAIGELLARGTLPWLVGGTGQYVWAVLEGWTVPKVAPDDLLRGDLATLAERDGREALHARLRAVDPVAAERIDPANVRRGIRALEVHHHTGTPISTWQRKGDPGFEFLVVGIDLPDAVLQARIAARVEAMYAAGFVEEVRSLLAHGLAADAPAMSSIGYQEAAQVALGALTEGRAIEQTIVATRKLVRRQRQWFRRTDERIAWASNVADVVGPVERFLGEPER